MKRVIICFTAIMLAIPLMLSGCRNPYASTPCGDFVYFTREGNYFPGGNSEEIVACLNGLSEQGKQKEIVVVPKTVDGHEVVALSYAWGIASLGELASNNLNTLYVPNYVYIDGFGTFNDCPNLEKIVFINVNGCRTPGYCPSRRDGFINVYYCSAYDGHDGYYVDDNIGRYANVSYMYNYEESENEGYYWVNNFDYGSTIKYIPENPEREGYLFGGWYKEPECVNIWDFDKDTLPEQKLDEEDREIYQETRLYAKWTTP